MPPPPFVVNTGGGGGSGGGGGGGSSSGGGGGSSSGGGGGSSSSGGGSSAPRFTDEQRRAARENPWVVFRKGKIKYVKSVLPPKNALKVFGLPAKRSDFLQARAHYNDLFGAWLGRRATGKEVARLLRSGTSDYQLRLAFTKKRGFRKSAMYNTLRQQSSDMLGVGNFKLSAGMVRRAMRAEGGISEASLRAVLVDTPRARQAVTRSFQRTSGKDVQYVLGAFGGGDLGRRGMQALALQESGLKQSTLGARIQSSVDKALARQQRIFSGTLATPQLSIGQSGLQATSLQPDQEADLPA